MVLTWIWSKLPPALLPRTCGIVPSGPLLDAGANSIAHLSRRLFGERDGDDAVDGPVRVLVELVQIAADQHPGLAGTRARIDNQCPVQGLDSGGLL